MTDRPRCYFVDASYLLELYAVPLFSDPEAIAAVRRRFGAAWKRGDRLLVPLGCLLELGNHIADIKNEPQRARWSGLLLDDVRDAVSDRARLRKFALVQAPPLERVLGLVEAWTTSHVREARGLVDTATAVAAREHKRERALGMPVHIWTRDRRPKGVEPDPEPDPFL